MDLVNLFIVFSVGIFGGFYGTLVGGTSIITIPLFIFLGLPPHMAIGTDRLGISGLALVGWYKFHEKGLVDYRSGLVMGVTALVGSFLGANIVLQIEVSVLKKVIAVLTLLLLAILVFKPGLGIEERKSSPTRRQYRIGLVYNFLVGIYGGFYGVLAGTFLLYGFLYFFGHTFLIATGTLKIASFMLTTMAAIVFASKGAIHYPMAGALFVGCAVGSYLGAHYSDRIGNVWIRRLFILIALIMSIKLILP